MRKPSSHKAIPEIKCKVTNPHIAAGNEDEGEIIDSAFIVEYPEYPDYQFLLHRPLKSYDKGTSDNGWTITEYRTGRRVSPQSYDTRASAIDHFRYTLGNVNHEQLKANIESYPQLNG